MECRENSLFIMASFPLILVPAVGDLLGRYPKLVPAKGEELWTIAACRSNDPLQVVVQ